MIRMFLGSLKVQQCLLQMFRVVGDEPGVTVSVLVVVDVVLEDFWLPSTARGGHALSSASAHRHTDTRTSVFQWTL